ncbi:DUF305 domain-containing protein [Phytohabitans sp. LJ34]|uniref:DUF305 domain-containing protein n=1 Tax=Phytohabitans sp. LJ34 TaxID=3452217 RepID=UPI003F88F5AC
MRDNAAIRRAGGLVSATALLVFAAACGGDADGESGHTGQRQPGADASASAGVAGHNDADVRFAQGMIPHHQQAVEMAELAGTRAANQQVKALAAKIAGAQAPEISVMTGWLATWGAPMPSTTEGGHDMGGSHAGMMSDADMAGLEKASGGEFDRMFLDMMIRHHEGALSMATAEQQQGQQPDAKALAKKIEADQTAEIQQMKTLLGTL